MKEHEPELASQSVAVRNHGQFTFTPPDSYFAELHSIISQTKATNKNGESLSLSEGMRFALKLIDELRERKGNKIILIGNGGSAAIASHQAVDFINAGGIPTITFNDSPLLTCMGNDFGYENIFAKPLLMLANPGDLLFAISSSGKSPSIIKGVEAAQQKGSEVVTFSGFDPKNPLRSLGDINFYVEDYQYGFVEVAHLSLIHYITDACKAKVRLK